MKWRIYHKQIGDFLYWDEAILEFNTEAQAQRFLNSAKNKMPLTDFSQVIIYRSMLITGEKLMNASAYIVQEDVETGEEILVFVGE